VIANGDFLEEPQKLNLNLHGSHDRSINPRPSSQCPDRGKREAQQQLALERSFLPANHRSIRSPHW
jgi:hypothetical protein